ncbi:hypothetical protein [Nostoc sp. ChiVER01]|nr:hypothetical protein [Nostoc sp. ChiVER01]MDZ8227244.1 hypothetical protein [Nostoc sp. ChiVER01]
MTAIESNALNGWLCQMLRLWVEFVTLIESTKVMLDLLGAKHSGNHSL